MMERSDNVRTYQGFINFLTCYYDYPILNQMIVLDQFEEFLVEFQTCLLSIEKANPGYIEKTLCLESLSLLVAINPKNKKLKCRFIRPKLASTPDKSNLKQIKDSIEDLFSYVSGHFQAKVKVEEEDDPDLDNEIYHGQG